MQQMVLQLVFGTELMELNQGHRKQFYGFNQCDENCLVCAMTETFEKLEAHMASADSPTKREPFAEIGANLIEQAILQARSNPMVPHT